MIGNNQKQQGGDASINVQARNINFGLTYDDVKGIFLDLFHANFIKLSHEAAETALFRATELVDQYLSTLAVRAPEALESSNDPDMQYSLFMAQKEYARTGDKELADILVDILVDRAKLKERNLLRLVLNESLQVAPKLTIAQLDTLSIIFLLKYTMNNDLLNPSNLKQYLVDFIAPFIDKLTKEISCYQHLEYTACASISSGSTYLFNIFNNNYSGLFCKGFSIDKYESISDKLSKKFIMPCFHNNTLWQINVMNEKEIDNLNIDAEFISQVKALQRSNYMNYAELKEYLIELEPKMEILFDVWENSMIANTSLTSVGIAIAHANIRRKTNKDMNLSIWIK